MLIDYNRVSIYQDDLCVLKDIDFNVDEGEFVYIIGKVGAGKSSLLKTLYCELDIESAEKAEVLGRDLMKIKRREVPEMRREMGIIFQDFQLLHDRTVGKNLDFVLKATGWKKSERNQRIDEVLEAVGLSDKVNKMPHELSGGEQQRIAIARALLNKPKIIVADEPTGNLDPETASNIVSLLRQISLTGTAIVMSTHNIPMLNKYPGIVYRCSETSISDITNTYNSIDLTEDKERA
ncbi:cell division ATP-binding protein FtsE [Prevotella koreensis]|uniref:Cell division ATP-binding protein FtsE n=1 Tax=Prevotella koreensis TaxID=2490854 RepID=A0A432LHQ9_9BACT|nr:ATP-binding cassette domain-containing protein [Prevotella koreensis]RUL58732.1 ATP-binding cassette domain-containing protein [Prevotella koreensis]